MLPSLIKQQETIMDVLPKQLQTIAENELNEVPQRVREDLNYFKEWLSKQPHLNARKDEKWLLNILRCSKWSIEKAKEKIDLFYTIKTKLPEIFKNRNPFLPPFQHIFERNIVSVLEPTTSDSPLVIVTNGKGNPKILHVVNLVRFNTMLLDILSYEYVNFLAGIIILYDFQDISSEYVKQITPTLLKKFVTCFILAYPVRIKAIIFVNVPAIFMYMSNILKSLMSTKLTERMHFFSDDGVQTIQNMIPLSVLPSDLGGTGPPMTSSKLQVLMESYADWFIDEEQYGCDETKRPVSRKLDIDLFGIDGSFRKLDVD